MMFKQLIPNYNSYTAIPAKFSGNKQLFAV
jgi:hypothetical protein